VTPKNLLRGSLLTAQSAGGLVRCFGRGHVGNFAVPERKTRHRKNKNIESRAKRALNKVPHLKSSPIGRGKEDCTPKKQTEANF
jgi:hypothetical protein